MDWERQYSKIFWGLGAMLVGAGIVALPLYGIRMLNLPDSIVFTSTDTTLLADARGGPAPADATDPNSMLYTDDTTAYVAHISDPSVFDPPAQGLFIIADLGEMMLRVYNDGRIEKEYPVLSKGKPGSAWETPTGIYKVRTKEEDHFSPLGNVWTPYSMQFFGNFFIHGWPRTATGADVPQGYQNGCIRLSSADAQDLFTRVPSGTKLVVKNGVPAGMVVGLAEQEKTPGLQFLQKTPENQPYITAGSAFAADLDSGFVFYKNNESESRPIASLSKLMTALVSVDTIDQSQPVIVTQADVEVEGDAGNLRANQLLTEAKLMYPLLLSSSNDAAYAMARPLGIERFVSLMNDKARNLGLTSTYFTEPSGLDPSNRSSSADVWKLMRYLWFDKRTVIDATQERVHDEWYNIHPFVTKESFEGGKTGFIPEAGKTITAIFTIPFGEFANRNVAIVILGSQDIRYDMERLRVWVKDSFYYGLPKPSAVATVPNSRSTTNEPFSILFTGDIMMDRGVESKIMKEGNGDWNFPFALISNELQNADITFGNLEGPISDKGADLHNLYSFRMDPQTTGALKNAGFDILSIANNHIGDWGREAMEDTFRRLKHEGLEFTGGGWNKQEALNPVIINVKGQRIGFIGFTDLGPNKFAAGETTAGINIATKESVQHAVAAARDKVDVLIASFHYGEEYKQNPTARQRELSRAAIDAGAQIVIGHHPHVVEPIEEYHGGAIAYSLGNFVFDQYFSKDTQRSIMLKIEFQGSEVTAVVPMPIDINRSSQPYISKEAGGN